MGNRIAVFFRVGFGALVIGLSGVLPAKAQTVWVGTTSNDWYDNTNWSPNTVPGSGDPVQVDTTSPNKAVINGGSGANAQTISVGTNSGDVGEIDLINAGTLTTSTFVFTVGNQGQGTLSLTGGSMVTIGNSDNLIVASQSNSQGTVTEDASIIQAAGGQVRVGDSGAGSLSETNGSQLSASKLEVGTFSGGSGQMTVDNSSVQVTNAIVGDAGTGTLTIQNDGSMAAGQLFIGYQNNGSNHGTVTVTGESGAGHSNIMVTGNLDVGVDGTGTLNVLAGGEVDAQNIRSGRDAGSTGAILVDGMGAVTSVPSTLHATNAISVGGPQDMPGGNGTLTITNGGVVNADNLLVVWGSGSNMGTLAIDKTYQITTPQLSFAGGTLHFLGSGVNFTNMALLEQPYGAGAGDMIAQVDGSNTDTISSSMSGDGALTKIGTGTLILSGNNTYAGNTNVNAGTLQLDGSITSETFVNAGGTLTGTGSINMAGITNDGVVSPGHGAIGTLGAEGTFQQNSDGTLQIGVAGLGPGQHGLLNVGQSQLDGTLQVLRLNNFSPMIGDRVTIIDDVPGGHSGAFSSLTSTFPGLLKPSVFYNEANDVYIVFQLSNTFLSQAMTRNQRSVAANIDNIVNDPRAADLINFLENDTMANLPHDYDLIAPEELASIYEIGFSQAVVTNMNLMHRMDDIHAGSTGYSGPVVEIPTGKDEAPISDKNVVTKNVAPAFVPCPQNRWGVFAVGSGDFVTVGNGDENARGYDLAEGSMLIGIDYRFGNHFAVGIDGEYANDIAQLTGNGRVYVDGGKAGAFATVYGYHFLGSSIWVDLAGNGGWNNYDTKRVGLQDEIVRGSTDGAEWNGMLAYGGDWTFGQLTIGTWSTLQYTDVQFNGFTETGSLAPLEFPDQDEDSFRSTSGVRASYNIKFGECGFFRPEVRVAWQHEYGDRAYPIDSRLASGAGDIFRVWGPTVGRDAALIDAGATWQLNARVATFAFYDGVVGRSNYSSHAVSGGLRIGF